MITLEHGDRRYENFTREDLISAGVPEEAIDAAALAQAKTAAVGAVDAAAAAARGRYVTLIPGQEMTYAEKERQARVYTALTDAGRQAADPADFNLLLPEAAAAGLEPLARAELILSRAAEWRELGGGIEAARLAGKDDVRSRRTIHTVEAARDAAIDALNAF